MCGALMMSAGADGYRIRELHTAAGTASLGCMGWINSAGGSRLAGAVYESGAAHASVSDAHGDMVLLDEGFALGVNSSGQAVGYSNGAAYWNEAGSLSHLLLPSNTWFSRANAINNAGQIVGMCAVGTSTVADYVMLWNGGDGQPVSLGEGCGTAINSGDSVAGYTQDSTGAHHAFVWTSGGGMSFLTGGLSSEANSLNDLGQAAGLMCDSTGGWACLWEANGAAKLLPNLAGALGSTAWGINNAGAVVGSCDTADGTYAVLWQPNGTLINLGQLPGHLSSVAYGISDSGQIAGCSLDESGMPHAVAWSPVPEPTSVIALLAGLAGLLPRLRRRQ